MIWFLSFFKFFICISFSNSVDNKNCRVRSATVLNGAHACPGQLIFNEDFNDRTISRERWIREHKFPGPPVF